MQWARASVTPHLLPFGHVETPPTHEAPVGTCRTGETASLAAWQGSRLPARAKMHNRANRGSRPRHGTTCWQPKRELTVSPQRPQLSGSFFKSTQWPSHKVPPVGTSSSSSSTNISVAGAGMGVAGREYQVPVTRASTCYCALHVASPEPHHGSFPALGGMQCSRLRQGQGQRAQVCNNS
jgi:hypothetical protein